VPTSAITAQVAADPVPVDPPQTPGDTPAVPTVPNPAPAPLPAATPAPVSAATPAPVAAVLPPVPGVFLS
jgi:translation initiation factor IF-2